MSRPYKQVIELLKAFYDNGCDMHTELPIPIFPCMQYINSSSFTEYSKPMAE